MNVAEKINDAVNEAVGEAMPQIMELLQPIIQKKLREKIGASGEQLYINRGMDAKRKLFKEKFKGNNIKPLAKELNIHFTTAYKWARDKN